jgi:CheY-like chemotaxis protein
MQKKIMAVDDEPSLIKLLTAILENEGYEVIPAYDGKDALKKLKKVKPDLILLDMRMPGMTGREVHEKILEDPKTRDIKVIFLTIVKISELSEELQKTIHVDDYITKPYDNADLIKRVKKVLK